VLGTLEGKASGVFWRGTARGHRILPGEINYRANIYAMKLLGVERIISVSAGRFAEGRFAAGRISRLRPVFSTAPKNRRLNFFWRRNRCPRGVLRTPPAGQLSGVLADACRA